MSFRLLNLEAMHTAKEQTPEYKRMHKATGQHQSLIENYKKFVEEERKKENQDQAQIFLLNSHLNLVTTWKMDIINGGYGTTIQLQHRCLVNLEKSILNYQKQE